MPIIHKMLGKISNVVAKRRKTVRLSPLHDAHHAAGLDSERKGTPPKTTTSIQPCAVVVWRVFGGEERQERNEWHSMAAGRDGERRGW